MSHYKALYKSTDTLLYHYLYHYFALRLGGGGLKQEAKSWLESRIFVVKTESFMYKNRVEALNQH